MRVLQIEPDYYTKYPPLGLLKLASYHRSYGDEIEFVRGLTEDANEPDTIEITSLFTFTWKSVHKSIEFYHKQFPDAKIVVGGIYATLMPKNIEFRFPYARVHQGLHLGAEGLLPSYDILKWVDKWKDWNKSIVFTTRGCIRKCPFCVVPKIEGRMKEPKFSVLPMIHPEHNEVVIWDNNFLASPFAKDILIELRDGGYRADFNQGLDARLMTEEFAGLLADIKSPSIHMAYDWPWEGPYISKAIDFLSNAGYRKRNLIFYVLHNFYDFKYEKGDTPADFFHRIRDLTDWGASAYPMRYIPLDSLTRSGFISPLWTAEQLEMIADARRVLGYAGTFVPYKGFVDKILSASTFEEAMELRPKRNISKGEEVVALVD